MTTSAKMLKEKNILICGGDKTASDFLREFLRKEGYDRVDVAVSPEDALKRITKERYQLVLLDIQPLGEDGIQTLRRIKEIDKNITVIMTADRSQAELAEKAVKKGAYDYILKPFDMAYLKLAVLTKILTDSERAR